MIDARLRENDSQRFTGKERDAETGLDYLGARYLSSAQERFTSPDPLLNGGRPWLPQSWNRYAYSMNNPLRFVDRNGLWGWDSKFNNGDKACEENRQKFRDAVGPVRACHATAAACAAADLRGRASRSGCAPQRR